MQIRKKVAALAAIAGLATTVSTGCVGMSRHAKSTMDLESKVASTLEDISKSTYCMRVSAAYTADKEDSAVKERKSQGYGTAFAFASDDAYTYLLTAGHVVESDEHITHWLLGSFTLKSQSMALVDSKLDSDEKDDVAIELFANYPNVDLAVIRAKKKLYVSHAYKTVDSKDLRVSEAAYVVGYPAGLFPFVSVGTIGNSKGVPNYGDTDAACMLLVDAEIAPGNSGSPLFVRRGDELYFAGVMRAKIAHVSVGVGNQCIEGRLPRVGTQVTGLGGLEGRAL